MEERGEGRAAQEIGGEESRSSYRRPAGSTAQGAAGGGQRAAAAAAEAGHLLDLDPAGQLVGDAALTWPSADDHCWVGDGEPSALHASLRACLSARQPAAGGVRAAKARGKPFEFDVASAWLGALKGVLGISPLLDVEGRHPLLRARGRQKQASEAFASSGRPRRCPLAVAGDSTLVRGDGAGTRPEGDERPKLAAARDPWPGLLSSCQLPSPRARAPSGKRVSCYDRPRTALPAQPAASVWRAEQGERASRPRAWPRWIGRFGSGGAGRQRRRPARFRWRRSAGLLLAPAPSPPTTTPFPTDPLVSRFPNPYPCNARLCPPRPRRRCRRRRPDHPVVSRRAAVFPQPSPPPPFLPLSHLAHPSHLPSPPLLARRPELAR